MTKDYRHSEGTAAHDIDALNLLDGHIIRLDDSRENAFVFVENDATSEYRWVACQELGSLVTLKEGQAFILWQKISDPDNSVSLYFPAIPRSRLSEEQLAERNKRVREQIKALDDLKVDVY
jgi:hypothetical protein